MGNVRENNNGRRWTTFSFDNEKKNFVIFCQNWTFCIFETKSSLSTSVFIFSTISQILKTKFHVVWTQTCRNLMSSTKIRPHAKIDNFSFKTRDIIIEGLIRKRKDYFSWKILEMQKNNFINKFYFRPNFYSYSFIQNFKKWCDFNKSRIIFSEKRIFTTLPFPIFGNKFFSGWNH